MSFIEGVGDEVVVFAVILLVLILAATVTFFLNSSPFNAYQEVPQISQVQSESSSVQNNEQENDELVVDDNRTDNVSDNNHPSSEGEAEVEIEELTHEGEVVEMSDNNGVSSGTADTHIYPNINDTVTSSPEESTIENGETQPSDPEAMHIRLKYLDDTTRIVTSHPSVKIGDFKRSHFVEDIANNKIVRLIFSGQLLQDNATLQSYGVTNNCVIHVQVLQAQTQQNPSSISQNTDLDLSHLLWPLLSVILGICWILYLKYPEFFNFMSLGMLLLFTGSFLYFYFQIQNQ